jgi:quercetin dioxygenase-like cupin family protein
MLNRAIDGPVILVEGINDAAVVIAESVKPYSVLKRPEVTVMALAFAAGAELREHSAPAVVLLQLRYGHVTVVADDREVDLRPDGLICLEARLAHSVMAHEESLLQLTVLSKEHPPVQ